MATKKPDTSSRIADNKKAAYNYFFEERFEAGMVLRRLGGQGPARRQGAADRRLRGDPRRRAVRDRLPDQSAQDARPPTSTPTAVRTKKLLLHKDEIRRLIGKVEQKGYTLVPLNLHWKAGKVKCEIALAKGKAEHDKRDTIKDREGKREVERAMKSRHR